MNAAANTEFLWALLRECLRASVGVLHHALARDAFLCIGGAVLGWGVRHLHGLRLRRAKYEKKHAARSAARAAARADATPALAAPDAALVEPDIAPAATPAAAPLESPGRELDPTQMDLVVYVRGGVDTMMRAALGADDALVRAEKKLEVAVAALAAARARTLDARKDVDEEKFNIKTAKRVRDAFDKVLKESDKKLYEAKMKLYGLPVCGNAADADAADTDADNDGPLPDPQLA